MINGLFRNMKMFLDKLGRSQGEPLYKRLSCLIIIIIIIELGQYLAQTNILEFV